MSETIHTISGLTLHVEKRDTGSGIEISFHTDDARQCLLHWGMRRPADAAWQIPPQGLWPEGSSSYGPGALQSPFVAHARQSRITIGLPPPEDLLSIDFVLFFPDTKQWDNNKGRNYRVELPRLEPHKPEIGAGSAELSSIVEEIVRAEIGSGSWTLMHRFNLCHDLLDRASRSVDGMALLFVWLRYSALRQLTWQRRYNTKPRELAHAQDRLTQKLAAVYNREPSSRSLVRLMLGTVGRGGEGQRIRDGILQIMHRHHIKEVAGQFMEEWHQKLHNNTTPDDIVICEAYLEFLRRDGDINAFYGKLGDGGVTRERLDTFERPIKTSPDFIPHLKDALIHDFENFLKTLKSVHSGADLETAIHTSHHRLDPGVRDLLRRISYKRHNSGVPLVELADLITEARRHLAGFLRGGHSLREVLYLDLALEQLLRTAVERSIHLQLSDAQLVDLIASVAENVILSFHDAEMSICWQHWNKLKAMPRFSPDGALHAKAALDRIGRVLGRFVDQTYQLLQPKAEQLGGAFHAEAWSITLFSEEVVRGGSAGFVLSVLLNRLDPILRKAAQLGNWQLISRGEGFGRVEVVDSLRSVQGRSYDGPRVVIAGSVIGDEEIPGGVTAIIAPNVTDIVSHVAVRARNARLLFAACYDAALFDGLKALAGLFVRASITDAGDVVFAQATDDVRTISVPPPTAVGPLGAPGFSAYAVTMKDFDRKIVGSKSFNQTILRSKLPKWIHTPSSIALPFGVFEKVLSMAPNETAARRYNALVRELDGGPANALSQLREAILQLTAPDELPGSLRKTMQEGGIPWPENWDDAWMSIKRVWASKWNDRAFLSRKAAGIAHDDLVMAVLIQQVVPAQYAYVLHTLNPFNGRPHELYGEIVLGLGETLVGNYPGRALSFICDKNTGKITLLSYPSKSLGIFGSGLIFRSDSTGEDLAGYAGAGLYDSILLPGPRHDLLDYAQTRLLWDETFRTQFIQTVGKIGMEVERALDSPQDIEGALADDKYFVVQTRPQVGLEVPSR